MQSRRPASSKTPLVCLIIGALAITASAAREDPWTLTVVPIGFGLLYFLERRGRARAIRARMPSAGSDPAWFGRVHQYCLWIWPDLRLHWWAPHTDRIPARLDVSASGITVTQRRRVGRNRLPPVQIPWSDVAGARSRDRGLFGHSGTTLTTVRQTAVTIDLIGMTADQWSLPAGQPPNSEGSKLRAGLDDQYRAIATELTTNEHPDWQPGTAPLVFITVAPEGLVELLTARAAAPHPNGDIDQPPTGIR